MWFVVSVVKGNRYFEPDSQIGNVMLISDTTEMVISGRSAGTDHYRFEARRGNETFTVSDFRGAQPAGALATRFQTLARQMGAVGAAGEA